MTGNSAFKKSLPEAPLQTRLDQLDALDPYFCWVENAKKYADQGYINHQAFDFALKQIEWMRRFEKKPLYEWSKGIFDRVFCLLLVLIFLPLFLYIALRIKIEDRGPIFYRQLRCGKNFQLFRIWKFRTMKEGSHRQIPFFFSTKKPLQKFDRDHRVTKTGYFLRRWKLDELPQLFNVLAGEMSLVGPRPLSVDDSIVCPEIYWSRFATYPGMTGYWQAQTPVVRDGNEKLRYDAEYVENRSWFLDLKLIYRTIFVVLQGKF